MPRSKTVTITLKPNVIDELENVAIAKGLTKSAVIALGIEEIAKQTARAIVEKEPFNSMVDKSGRREASRADK
jgi:hypothetical protein